LPVCYDTLYVNIPKHNFHIVCNLNGDDLIWAAFLDTVFTVDSLNMFFLMEIMSIYKIFLRRVNFISLHCISLLLIHFITLYISPTHLLCEAAKTTSITLGSKVIDPIRATISRATLFFVTMWNIECTLKVYSGHKVAQIVTWHE